MLVAIAQLTAHAPARRASHVIEDGIESTPTNPRLSLLFPSLPHRDFFWFIRFANEPKINLTQR